MCIRTYLYKYVYGIERHSYKNPFIHGYNHTYYILHIILLYIIYNIHIMYDYLHTVLFMAVCMSYINCCSNYVNVM